MQPFWTISRVPVEVRSRRSKPCMWAYSRDGGRPTRRRVIGTTRNTPKVNKWPANLQKIRRRVLLVGAASTCKCFARGPRPCSLLTSSTPTNSRAGPRSRSRVDHFEFGILPLSASIGKRMIGHQLLCLPMDNSSLTQRQTSTGLMAHPAHVDHTRSSSSDCLRRDDVTGAWGVATGVCVFLWVGLRTDPFFPPWAGWW